MSSAFFLLLCLSILLISVASSSSYNIYSDSACNNQIASGSGIGTPSSTVAGATILATACFTVSGVAGNGYGEISCLTNPGPNTGPYSNALALYSSQANCQGGNPSITYVGTANNSQTCVASLPAGTYATWTCNSGLNVYAVSFPLMLLLALLAIFAI